MGPFIRVVITSSLLASTFLVGGCFTEPEPDTAESGVIEVARTAPTHSVSGGGRIDYGPGLGVPAGYTEHYGFSARARPDGTVEGNLTMQWDPPYDFRLQADITCLSVVDNSAWIGLVVTHNSGGSVFAEGDELRFEVRDNGAGQGDAPDQLSFFRDGPADDCNLLKRGGSGLIDWTHGNVTVR